MAIACFESEKNTQDSSTAAENPNDTGTEDEDTGISDTDNPQHLDTASNQGQEHCDALVLESSVQTHSCTLDGNTGTISYARKNF